MRWHDDLNIDEVKSCVFEYSWSDLMGFWIFKRHRHGLFWISMKLSHGYFEYSWSDVMGILNVQKLTSSVNHEMASWVFWILKSWRHGHFEYLWGDIIGILNTKWRYGIIQKLTPWVFWIFIVTLLFLIFKISSFLNIHSNDVTSRIFKNTNVTMNIQNTHDASF